METFCGSSRNQNKTKKICFSFLFPIPKDSRIGAQPVLGDARRPEDEATRPEDEATRPEDAWASEWCEWAEVRHPRRTSLLVVSKTAQRQNRYSPQLQQGVRPVGGKARQWCCQGEKCQLVTCDRLWWRRWWDWRAWRCSSVMVWWKFGWRIPGLVDLRPHLQRISAVFWWEWCGYQIGRCLLTREYGFFPQDHKIGH